VTAAVMMMMMMMIVIVIAISVLKIVIEALEERTIM
jgi:hypothetical protein